MGQSPRYTTFREGELEAALHRLDPQGQHHRQAEAVGGSVRSRSGLVTGHVCTVTYPDGQTGTCRYTRGGPAWHIFRFEHTGRYGKTTSLPVQYETQRIENGITVIEENASRLASRAFSEAVKREQREYFRRAVPPASYRVTPDTPSQSARCPEASPQMKMKEAKEAGGKYALCIRVGRSILPTGATWDTLDEAAAAWRTTGNVSLVIGCCCRWKRRWEEPEFNPLHDSPGYPQAFLFPCPGSEPGLKKAFYALQEEVDHEELGTDKVRDSGSKEQEIPHSEQPLFPLPGDKDVPPEEPDNSPDPLWWNEMQHFDEGGMRK